MKYVSEGLKFVYLPIYIRFPMMILCLLFIFNENFHFQGILGPKMGFPDNRCTKCRGHVMKYVSKGLKFVFTHLYLVLHGLVLLINLLHRILPLWPFFDPFPLWRHAGGQIFRISKFGCIHRIPRPQITTNMIF